ncbi:multi-component transcriptional regulator [Chondrocystis sp. NIES-4102]|nr:multi-component transcriptional regulator [Chondrocystis sp. NIES-4102]
MKILLIDDDETLVDLLTRSLKEKSYAIDVARDGEQGWIYGSTYSYDLIIIDWLLPKLDGISLCKKFRAHGYHTPILLLTSRHGSQNKIKGLDAGADDYLCKPVDVEELSARIRALLRRLNCNFLPVLSWGNLQLNQYSCQVTYQGEELPLTAKEYRLLELFLRHPQEVITLADIIESLWSSMEYPVEATVRSHIRRLRDKLKLVGLPEDLITTVRGQGYCLKVLSQNQILEEDKLSNSKQTKHLKALTTIWKKYQPKKAQQLAILQQASARLQTGELEVSDRVSAIIAAHSLAGTLGQFGLDQASLLAKEIEQLLQDNQPQELINKITILSSQISGDRSLDSLPYPTIFSQSQPDLGNNLHPKEINNSPLLLIINDEPNFTAQLTQAATSQGIETLVLSTPSVRNWLDQQQLQQQQLPHAVLLTINFANSTPDWRLQQLSLIAEFNLLQPAIPVIVLADRDHFKDRLQVVRHGGAFYLTQPSTPSQIMSFCHQILQRSTIRKNIMIVDDDQELLQILPSLLEPWGFKFTTLHDPRQFWEVLQAFHPDLLVLDIEMPHLSGIELCKVLRTHPYWYKLPVLFLTIHQDLAISAEAYACGATDFMNKPVIPQQLAHRIIHRLS